MGWNFGCDRYVLIFSFDCLCSILGWMLLIKKESGKFLEIRIKSFMVVLVIIEKNFKWFVVDGYGYWGIIEFV